MMKYNPILKTLLLLLFILTLPPAPASLREVQAQGNSANASLSTTSGGWVHTNGPSGGILCTIEIDRHSPETLYAGGNGGVFKTTDGGASWTVLGETVPPPQEIGDLLLSPDDPRVLYALSGRLYKSIDGGESWRVPDEERWFSCIAMQSSNASVLIAGDWAGRVYRSTDGADSWTDITGNLPGDSVNDIAVGSSNEFWAGTANGVNGRLYHSTDGGLSWNTTDIGQGAETDINTIFVDPDDSGIVYVGLVDVHNEVFDSDDNYLLKTVDGGTTWTPLRLPQTDAMINVIGRATGDDALYVGTGGTVFKSNDGGQSWTWIGPPGRNGDMYDIAVDPRDSEVLYLPRRGSGIVKSTNGGTSWTPINQGLFNVAISLLAVPNVSGSGTVYATSVGGEGTFVTTDYGNTWECVTEGGITHPWADELVVSPHDPETVWQVADVAEVFETQDGGRTWVKIIDPYGAGFRFGSVYAVAPAPSDPDTIYALKNGFGIFKSTNGGEYWQFQHQSEVDYTYSMAVHPTNPSILYSGYSRKPFQDWAMVRQTTDGGNSWRTALIVPDAAAVTSVVIDPNAPDTVYAGSTGESGSVWVSRDAGNSWSNVNEHFNFTNIHVMAIDPCNPDVAYAGVWGGGTFVTSDAGQSWSRLRNDPTISASAILVDPNDSDVIYLGDRTLPRIYRTIDGGATWSTFFDAGPGYYRVLTVALAPSDPDILYASVFKNGGPMAGDAFRIEGGEGVVVTGTLPRLPVALAVDPSDEDRAYAVLHAYGVYVTGDGGQSWNTISELGSGLPQEPQVGFGGLVVDPTDPDVLYLFGGCDVDIDFSHSGADPAVMNTVYRSTDAGTTWDNLNDGTLGVASGSIKGLTISPVDPTVLYVGALNGIFRSSDGGASWHDEGAGLGYTHTAGVALSSDGMYLYAPTLGGGFFVGEVHTSTHEISWDTTSHLRSSIFHVQIAVDPTDSMTLYASAYPGGTFKSVDRGETWSECNFGVASFEIDDPNRQGYYAFAIAPTDPSVLYLGLYGIGIYKSTDGAETWQPMNGSARTMRGMDILSLLIDPVDPDTVLVATSDGIYRSTDGGSSWHEFSEGLNCRDIRTLAVGSDGTLYAGSRGHELFARSQHAPDWKQMSAFGNFGVLWPVWDDRPLYQYTSLLFHPTDPAVIYFGTFPAGIYKSIDGGQSWKESNVGWTNDGVFCLKFHPENSEIIYAGTYNGMNRSTDGGAHWEVWDEGWPEEQWVFSIDFDPRDPDVMYACSKNGENEGAGREDFHGTVMKSLNGGASWMPIINGLEIGQEFYKIIVDSHLPDTVYLATQSEGVFVSSDGGANWWPWNEDLTNLVPGTNGNNVTNTMVLSADGRYLYFGSAGSGVFRRMTVSFERIISMPLILKSGLRQDP